MSVQYLSRPRGLRRFVAPIRIALLLLVSVLLVVGCNRRPTLGECKRALRNRISLLNKDNREARENALREVDRLSKLCASGMKRESVMCDIKAKTVQELNRCR